MQMFQSNSINAAAYVRFSSERQREESVDGQLRAIKKYAQENGINIVNQYIDRAKTATNDQRAEFQKMIQDSKKNRFNMVLVHKLDRFARNRIDATLYRRELHKSNVSLQSVTETFDDTPESQMLEAMIEAFNEYYSKNLAREVEKGKIENALKARHVGGIPPLGYDLDRKTMKLVVNSKEAEAVKLIFDLYVAGYGYNSIIKRLNEQGYRTKKDKYFGKGSIYEILRNEKYVGIYTYNKMKSKNTFGKRNYHSQKSENEIIRIQNGVPQIIADELFEKVQIKMEQRKRKHSLHNQPNYYALSGKIICGECGSAYSGNSRRPSRDRDYYLSYNCTKKNGSIKCDNPQINKNIIEENVFERIKEYFSNNATVKKLLEHFKCEIESKTIILKQELKSSKKMLGDANKEIENLVAIIVNKRSSALNNRLILLEDKKADIEYKVNDLEIALTDIKYDFSNIKKNIRKILNFFNKNDFCGYEQIINNHIQNIIMNRNNFLIRIKIHETYSIILNCDR